VSRSSQHELRWRKASASASSNCVEVAMTPDAIYVRDSKAPNAGMLTFTKSEWAAFLTGVGMGEFDLAAQRGS
jgi:hypothetical protein